MPTKVAVHLARTYRDEITRLHERFGGYASFWLYCAERLTEATPQSDFVPYPLWESAAWQDWITEPERASDRTPIQSAPFPRCVSRSMCRRGSLFTRIHGLHPDHSWSKGGLS